MISSLTSRFEFYARRMLFVSTHKVAVYHWTNGDLGSSYLFDIDNEGKENFRRYLKETSKIPVYVMVDVFEEEYRQDTIPHVFGTDRASIIKRKVGRLFRNTPYYYHQVIGREEEGRRDDRVLLTAITNPDTVQTWIAMLDEEKIPMAGIYSLPLFTEKVLRNIEEQQSSHKLIVSIQSISGLRQTYFYNEKFRISRLVQMPRYGTVPYGPHIKAEVEKIRRYLDSLRLISPDESLQIYFLLAGELLQELKQEYAQGGSSRYHFCDLNELLGSAGSGKKLATPFSDQYFAYQLLKSRPANFYASGKERRYFSMRRMRYAMLTTSIMLIFAGVIWSSMNFMGGITYKQRSIAAQKKTQFYTARYQLARERLPETPVEPAELKTAIDIADKIKTYKSTPFDMVQVVSRSMNRFPAIQLAKMKWTADTDPNANFGKSPVKTANQTMVGVSNLSFTETGYDLYQIAQIDGRIEPFDGNYRTAIELINSFVESIRQHEQVFDVSIVTLPLDVSSESSLQGTAQAQSSQADFSIRVVLGVKHGV